MLAEWAFYALMRGAGIGVSMIEKCKTVLCSLFNTAVNDRVLGQHPCRAVTSPIVVQAPLQILTPAEYARLRAGLRDDYARLMVDVLLESGVGGVSSRNSGSGTWISSRAR